MLSKVINVKVVEEKYKSLLTYFYYNIVLCLLKSSTLDIPSDNSTQFFGN